MIRAFALLVLLPLVAGAPACGAEPPAPEVASVSATGYAVRVMFGEPAVMTGERHGLPFAEIDLPASVPEAPAGTPQLPARVLHLRVPWGVDARVRATPGAGRPLGTLRPVPVPGLLTVPAIAASVGAAELRAWIAGPAYSEPGADPALAEARVSAAAGERFLEVRLRPVRWDPVSGAATALESALLEVTWDRPIEPLSADAPSGLRAHSLAPLRAVGPRYPSAPRRSRAPARAPAAPAAAGAAPLRVDPARPWIRLGVTRPGLYVLSPQDLASAGVSVAGLDPATFRLFRARPGDLPESVDVDLGPDSLAECAVTVTGEGDGSFDPADRIYFYATGSMGFGADLRAGGSLNYEESVRSGEEPLWLTWGGPALPGPPRRMTTRSAAPVSAVPVLDYVTHRVHLEENRDYVPELFQPGLRWDRWLYVLVTEGSAQRIAFPVPGALVGGAGSIVARIWGVGSSVGFGSPGPYLYDHYMRLSWNRVQVASAEWDFTRPRDLTASGFAMTVRDTIDFRVPLFFDPTDPNRNDRSYLAWFEITYPRRLAATNDTLRFVGPDSVAAPGRTQYRITGVSDAAAAWLLDCTDPENPVVLEGGGVSGAAPSFTLTVEDSTGPGYRPRYVLVSRARAATPPSIARYAPVAPGGAYVIHDLLDPANGADYLIVTHPSLLGEAQTLAQYRAPRLVGFAPPRVRIATMDRIAAQLGGGLSDPVAVRNLLVYAQRHWSGAPPTYVCILGDATVDPRNFEGLGDPDLVPAYANYYSVGLNSAYTSDDFYGYLDGDGLLDLVIGRIPAMDAAEARTIIEAKLPAFENSTELDPWRIRALLVADDSWKRELPDELGNAHVLQMERKDGRHLAFPVERSKVYLNDYAWSDTLHQSKPAAREEFIRRVNEGNWLVDYVGHGSEDLLADEQVFRAFDAGRLTNASRLSIFAFISCTVGKFDATGDEGLGELVLQLPTGGAAASLAATHPVFPTQSTELNDALVDALFPLHPRADSVETLGLAWARAKNANVGENTRKYQLLGDPALTLPFPRGRGSWEKAPLDSVLRGDVVTMSGRALNPDSTLDSTASGTALVEVRGTPIRRTQVQQAPFTQSTTYWMPGPVLYRGEAAVSNGRFSVQFVVPTDGRVAGPGGKLRALLTSAGGRGTGLATDSIRIAQGAVPRVDTTPPAISLRYPSASASDSTVKPGDRLTIVLTDSSGIDLTRLDNAHTIFTVLDELGQPVELTPAFSYDPGSHTRGSAPYVVPSLAEGPHLLEVRASDTYGNIGSRAFVLDVRAGFVPGDPLFLSQVFNYPNPFEQGTYLHARLNQPARLRVQVLTVAGRRVRELSADGAAGENYLFWDGNDSTGEKVAIGVYLMRVVAETPGGKRATAVGRALRKE